MNTRPSLFESDSNSLDVWIGDRTPDPSLFLPWVEQDRLLDSIRHLLEDTADVVLLVGPHGSGKTTFVYRMQTQLQDHWLLCRVDANPMLYTDQLQQRLARQIGFGYDSPQDISAHTEYHTTDRSFDTANEQNLPVPTTATEDTLHSNFGNLRLQGRLPVVLVDDADQLPPKTLLFLLHLHERTVEGLSPFALLLLTETAIDETLGLQYHSQLGGSKFQRLNMPRLVPEQIKDYILHFLRVEGVKKTPYLTSEHVVVLHKESAGVPGRLNILIKQALREDTQSEDTRSLPHKLLRLFVILIMITSVGLGMLQLPMVYNLPVVQEFLAQLYDKPAKSTHAQEPQALAPMDWISHVLPLPKVTENTTTTQYHATSGDKPEITGGNAVATPTGTYVPGMQEVPLIVPPTPVQKLTDAISTVLSPPSTKATDGAIAQIQPTVPEVPEVVEQPPLTSSRYKKNMWLSQQTATSYTIQLVAMTEELVAQHYVEKNNIGDAVFYVEAKRENKPVYYVLYGAYKTKAQATTAMRKLPSELRKKGAWPRSFGRIQAELP